MDRESVASWIIASEGHTRAEAVGIVFRPDGHASVLLDMLFGAFKTIKRYLDPKSSRTSKWLRTQDNLSTSLSRLLSGGARLYHVALFGCGGT